MQYYVLPFAHKHFEVENTRNIAQYFEGIMKSISFKRKEFESRAKSVDLLYSGGFLFCTHDVCDRMNSKQGFEEQSSFKDKYRQRTNVLLGENRMAMLAIPETDQFLTFHDTALYSLTAACVLDLERMSWDSELFVTYVKGFSFKTKPVRCQFQTFPKPLTAEGSLLQYLTAQDFVENLTGSDTCSSPSVRLMFIMSMAFLKRALECNDTYYTSVAPAALVYLAALHFASLEFQIAIDICFAVLIEQTFYGESETMNAACLFFIEDIVRIIGFCLLFKQINDKKFFFL